MLVLILSILAPDEMMAELDQRKERLRQAALQRQAEEEEGEGELPIGEDDEVRPLSSLNIPLFTQFFVCQGWV